MKILAVGAHPDDIEYGCGGTLLKYPTAAVHAVVLARYMENGPRRANEQHRAHEVYPNLTFEWGPETDTEIDFKSTLAFIEAKIEKVNPNLVFGPYPDDTHQDHCVVGEAVKTAMRRRGNVLFYESISSYQYVPTVFSDITPTLAKKVGSLRCHESQCQKLHLAKRAESLAQHRGWEIGVKYAEAFIPHNYQI